MIEETGIECASIGCPYDATVYIQPTNGEASDMNLCGYHAVSQLKVWERSTPRIGTTFSRLPRGPQYPVGPKP